MNYFIVLGSSDKKILRARVERAVQLVQECEYSSSTLLHDSEDSWGKNTNSIMIFSGISPEAENMRNIARTLLREDFPDYALILENTSRNTWENIVNSRDLMYKLRLNRFDMTNVTVVSSAFHIPRVQIICDALLSKDEFIITCVPTDEPITEYRRTNEILLVKHLHTFLDQCDIK